MRVELEKYDEYSLLLAGDSTVKPMPAKFVEMIRKHLPLMRTPEYGLTRAADHLEAWVDGKLPLDDFADISSPFGTNTSTCCWA